MRESSSISFSAPQLWLPSHGSTLVRNYLLRQRRLSPDKILRALTPPSFGIDLQGRLFEALVGARGWWGAQSPSVHSTNSGVSSLYNKQQTQGSVTGDSTKKKKKQERDMTSDT